VAKNGDSQVAIDTIAIVAEAVEGVSEAIVDENLIFDV